VSLSLPANQAEEIALVSLMQALASKGLIGQAYVAAWDYEDGLRSTLYEGAADLFVHPGVQETFGLVALESQACGTPVVGIRGSYMDRIIFHEQESWARENTPAALADAIEDLSGKKLSILGGSAAVAAEESHSWPRVFEQLFCIYREVCAKYRRP